jgi:hypothetical protein
MVSKQRQGCEAAPFLRQETRLLLELWFGNPFLLAAPPPPPAVCIVWWTLQLQGSFALFWLAYFVTLSCGIGEWNGDS